MGDGINNISALHAADVGISVDSAADIAKETAEIVLLEKDLAVLVQGIREGRITFANTLNATLTVVAVTVALLYTPIAPLIGFEPLPLRLLCLLGVIVMLYISMAEIAKHIFYRLVKM